MLKNYCLKKGSVCVKMLTNKEAWKILSFAAILTSTQCQTPTERLFENDLKLHVTNAKSVLVSEKQHLGTHLKTTQIDDKAFFLSGIGSRVQ